MLGGLGTVFLALVTWIVFNAVGKPLLAFFDLRTEIRRSMILYGNVAARWRETVAGLVPADGTNEMPPEALERLRAAENQYRELGAQVRAFADTQSPTCFVLKRMGFDVRMAASGLIGLSNTISTYGKNRAFQTETINSALKFKNAA